MKREEGHRMKEDSKMGEGGREREKEKGGGVMDCIKRHTDRQRETMAKKRINRKKEASTLELKQIKAKNY